MQLRALIFDDEECIRQMLRFMLAAEGCEVVTFDDPMSFPPYRHKGCACNFMHACADMLISDLYMLPVSGFQFIESLKTAGCKIPCIALMSGNWTALDLVKAKTLGLHVFEKPFHVKDVRLWLEECREKIPNNRILQDALHVSGAAEQKKMTVRPGFGRLSI